MTSSSKVGRCGCQHSTWVGIRTQSISNLHFFTSVFRGRGRSSFAQSNVDLKFDPRLVTPSLVTIPVFLAAGQGECNQCFVLTPPECFNKILVPSFCYFSMTINITNYTASQPRRPPHETSPPWKLQNSQHN